MNTMLESYGHSAFRGRIGVARRDITPPVGIYSRCWGAAKHDVAEGVHRSLTLTVLTLRSAAGSPPCALAAVDLGGLENPRNNEVVEAVRQALGLDPARCLVACAHTHAGPGLGRMPVEVPGGHLIAPYYEHLKRSAAEAAREALAGEREATLTFGYGRCSLATNRDLPDPERKRVICGFNPAGVADDALLVGRVTDRAGRIFATLVNYACHPTTLAWDNRRLSPDWVGAMREVVEERTAGAPCVFIQGASGELAPREQYSGDSELADKNGRQVGYAALSALESLLPPDTQLEYGGVMESGAPLATWRRAPYQASGILEAIQIQVELPVKADMPSAAELEERFRNTPDRVAAERLRRKLGLRRTLGEGRQAAMPLWVWRIGDAFLVAHINEAYSRLQTELRRQWPGRAVLVGNLVNGSCGYLPPEEFFDLDLYPVWQTPFERGCLEATIKAGGEALRRLDKASGA